MILTPFKIVWELIVFGLQAAFLYGLALIIAIGFIAYAIAQHPPTPKKRVESETRKNRIYQEGISNTRRSNKRTRVY